jgi:hypothetical protein
LSLKLLVSVFELSKDRFVPIEWVLQLAISSQKLRHGLKRIKHRLFIFFKILQMALVMIDQELSQVLGIGAQDLHVRLLASPRITSLKVGDWVFLHVV